MCNTPTAMHVLCSRAADLETRTIPKDQLTWQHTNPVVAGLLATWGLEDYL